MVCQLLRRTICCPCQIHLKESGAAAGGAALPVVAVVACGQAGPDMGQKEREGGQQGERGQRQETIATIAKFATIVTIATILMMTERRKKL